MAELLKVEHLSAGYGEAVVLNDISFALGEGRTLALLGRNGTGKTTLINTLAGATRQHAGTLTLAGAALHKLAPHQRAAAGIGWVPQERNIFKSLTVHENLTAVARPGKWTPDGVYAMFPRLAERKGNLGTQLSGGEQQMLAVARALVLNPRLLLLDEPLEGLAPIIVTELLRAIARITRQEGLSAIIVEQHPLAILDISHKLHEVIAVADRVTVLRGGRSVKTLPIAGATPRSLAELMVGRDVDATQRVARTVPHGAEIVLQLDGVWADGDRGAPAISDVDLRLRRGRSSGSPVWRGTASGS
jgi:branched-chain amino acid transport system ATP-binding protein